MITIEVKNTGLTNSMSFASRDGKDKYDIEGLLKREGIYDKIVDLASSEALCTMDKKFHFESLVNKIYTCIKIARAQNFNEDFWTDWEDK
jgi:hypothetical protein